MARAARAGGVPRDSGGYHHHVGANTWQSQGAPYAPDDRARLIGATIHGAAEDAGDPGSVRDPADLHDGSLGFPAMEAEDLGLDTHRDLQGVYRYYELAKRAEWQVRDLPWGEIPPIPEYSGSPQKLARRRDLWRSVITQQLQADELAVEMATQLFAIAPDHEAKLYYTTMVQDESRHTEAWLKLIAESGGMAERDPHLDQLAHMTLDADTLEEKVFVMQVFYERLIIPRFRMIARSSRGTILEDLCNRLTIDDGIHHGAGMAYERVLLEGAGRGIQTKLIDAANRMLPLFTQHALWRPKAREFIGALMRETDIRMLKEDLEQGVRLAKSLGIDVSDIELPAELH